MPPVDVGVSGGDRESRVAFNKSNLLDESNLNPNDVTNTNMQPDDEMPFQPGNPSRKGQNPGAEQFEGGGRDRGRPPLTK